MKKMYRLITALWLLVFLIIIGVVLRTVSVGPVTAQGTGYSLRFYGTGAGDIDRVKIPLDNPERPVDIGAGDFTIEWWMKGSLADNPSTTVSCNTNDGWITGNIIFDRDIWGVGDYGDYGVSLSNGRVAFGVNNGSSGNTVCGNTNVLDNSWHYVALTRSVTTGELRIFTDGQLDAQANGPSGNVSYRNGRTTAYANDPFLVIGAEKHDAGSAYPSYSGWVDEIRISNTVRYTSTFARPVTPFTTDANTITLYHADEGGGSILTDTSGATGGPSQGTVNYGGAPPGPVWSTDTPFSGTTSPSPSPSIAPSPSLIPSPTPSPSASPSSTPSLRGDANGDGMVNLADIREVVSQWLNTLTSLVDQNGDGKINSFDLGIVLSVLITAPSPSPATSPSPQTSPLPSASPTLSSEWTQHAHDAQHTSYTPTSVPAPWRWKWMWGGRQVVPRNVQPVTGGGRVYIADDTVYALNINTGAQIWATTPGGNIQATPAYDPATGRLYVVSTNGSVYAMDAASGITLASFNTGAGTNMPPALYGDTLFVSSSSRVYSLNKADLSQRWVYNAGSNVQTPPAYSSSKNTVVITTQDLYAHAINSINGTRRWRIKPMPDSVYTPDPGETEFLWGWPVIAEQHGLVLIQLRYPWSTAMEGWPATNQEMRLMVQTYPERQGLYALNIDNGILAFTPHVGHAGWGDGGYMPMGTMPVVKQFPNGEEVAYVVMRSAEHLPQAPTTNYPNDDSRFGELMLDDARAPAFLAGYVRFMDNQTSHFPSDERPYLTMAGNHLFAAHWAFGIAHNITDRSGTRGTNGSNAILVSDLPHMMESQRPRAEGGDCDQNSASHYCPNGLVNDQDWRAVPAGFWIYWNGGTIYDQYWNNYSSWVVSDNTVFYRSNTGALVALENGNP